MKTAISVPDPSFERAERLARQHGMNRSQFYTEAAERFADELESDDLTEAINQSLDALDADGAAEFAVLAGRRLLGREGADEW